MMLSCACLLSSDAVSSLWVQVSLTPLPDGYPNLTQQRTSRPQRKVYCRSSGDATWVKTNNPREVADAKGATDQVENGLSESWQRAVGRFAQSGQARKA